MYRTKDRFKCMKETEEKLMKDLLNNNQEDHLLSARDCVEFMRELVCKGKSFEDENIKVNIVYKKDNTVLVISSKPYHNTTLRQYFILFSSTDGIIFNRVVGNSETITKYISSLVNQDNDIINQVKVMLFHS